MDEPTQQDAAGNADRSEGGVGRRLFIGFLLIVATAVICWKVLPAAGVDVPWFVPVLGFAVIVISVLARRLDSPGDDGDDEGEAEDEEDGVAGRIGHEPGEND